MCELKYAKFCSVLSPILQTRKDTKIVDRAPAVWFTSWMFSQTRTLRLPNVTAKNTQFLFFSDLCFSSFFMSLLPLTISQFINSLEGSDSKQLKNWRVLIKVTCDFFSSTIESDLVSSANKRPVDQKMEYWQQEPARGVGRCCAQTWTHAHTSFHREETGWRTLSQSSPKPAGETNQNTTSLLPACSQLLHPPAISPGHLAMWLLQKQNGWEKCTALTLKQSIPPMIGDYAQAAFYLWPGVGDLGGRGAGDWGVRGSREGQRQSFQEYFNLSRPIALIPLKVPISVSIFHMVVISTHMNLYGIFWMPLSLQLDNNFLNR